MITAGFDIGTRMFKICLVQGTEMMAAISRPSERNLEKYIRTTYQELLTSTGLKARSITKAIATGYGANLASAAAYELSEPACIARGVNQLSSGPMTVIDVGALFIRIVNIDENGFLEDHVENEPCAAGSGKFLELAAGALEIPFENLSEYVYRAQKPYTITSTCAVFAESELISQVNAGICSEDILAGVMNALVFKVISLLGKAGGCRERVALSGGVARIPAFREKLCHELHIAPTVLNLDPSMLQAYGAALLAQGRKR